MKKLNKQTKLYANNLPNTKWYSYPCSIIFGSIIFFGYHVSRAIIDSIELSRILIRKYKETRKHTNKETKKDTREEKESCLSDLIQ